MLSTLLLPAMLMNSACGPSCITVPTFVRAEGTPQHVAETFVHAYTQFETTVDQVVNVYDTFTDQSSSWTWLRLSEGSDLILARTSSGAPAFIGSVYVDCYIGDDFVFLLEDDPSLDRVTFDGGSGNDILWAGSQPVVFHGGPGDDVLLGGPGDDILRGGGGSDYVWGGPGDDDIVAPGHMSYVFGGEGNDVIEGGDAEDFLFGGDGDDEIVGGAGDDFLYGNDGDDEIEGGEGDDSIEAGLGADRIDAGDGDDFVLGGDGDDIILGMGGTDELYGGPGNDVLRDTGGDSRLFGGAGDDLLDCVDGIYHIFSVDSSVYLDGGAGADFYVVDLGGDVYVQIRDEPDDAIDVLWILGPFFGSLARDGDDLVIETRYGAPPHLVPTPHRLLTIINQFAGDGTGIDELWYYPSCTSWDDDNCIDRGPSFMTDLRALMLEPGDFVSTCLADLSNDGVVGSADLARLLAVFETTSPAEDFDNDGFVSASDLATLLAAWGDCPKDE